LACFFSEVKKSPTSPSSPSCPPLLPTAVRPSTPCSTSSPAPWSGWAKETSGSRSQEGATAVRRGLAAAAHSVTARVAAARGESFWRRYKRAAAGGISRPVRHVSPHPSRCWETLTRWRCVPDPVTDSRIPTRDEVFGRCRGEQRQTERRLMLGCVRTRQRQCAAMSEKAEPHATSGSSCSRPHWLRIKGGDTSCTSRPEASAPRCSYKYLKNGGDTSKG
ncbi:unnamed protein product, partial [Urochloa humidicola]